MEIKTFSSALVLSFLMASPAAMAMDEEKVGNGIVVQSSTPSDPLPPSPLDPVTEDDTLTGVSSSVAPKEEDTNAIVPYLGIWNGWGLFGSSTPEKMEAPASAPVVKLELEMIVEALAPAIVGQQEIENEKLAEEKSTVKITPDAPGNAGGLSFPWSLWGSTTKTAVAAPTPETNTPPSSPAPSTPSEEQALGEEPESKAEASSEPVSTPLVVAPEPVEKEKEVSSDTAAASQPPQVGEENSVSEEDFMKQSIDFMNVDPVSYKRMVEGLLNPSDEEKFNHAKETANEVYGEAKKKKEEAKAQAQQSSPSIAKGKKEEVSLIWKIMGY
jgi:hypothetical protein